MVKRQSVLITNDEDQKEKDFVEDNECGFLLFKGPFLQRFASKKLYVLIHGLLGCLYAACFSYFNGTITTFEKRLSIPSRNSGIIATGFQCSAIISAPILSHYLANKHRPRWIAVSSLSMALFCFLSAGLHLIYGPGEDALLLTTEYGAIYDLNATVLAIEQQKLLELKKSLCQLDENNKVTCDSNAGQLFPQIYLFVIFFSTGIFGGVFESLGTSYMDDNVKKTKAPFMISITYFLRLLGTAVGYAVSSLSLSYYIAPSLTPTITQNDRRWLGAWWSGWLFLGSLNMLLAFFVAFFPKELPRSAQRNKMIQKKQNLKGESDNRLIKPGITIALKRVLTNKTFMLNTFGGLISIFGYLPFLMFIPKYIEVQYKQSASVASLVSGPLVLVCTAFGVLSAGVVIQKLKPKARTIASWNVFVGVLSSVIIFSFIFLGCSENDNETILSKSIRQSTCYTNCNCDFVKYNPICGGDGFTYISPCHAGCSNVTILSNGTKFYENCSCIEPDQLRSAIAGACSIDCYRPLLMFLAFICVNKFLVSTGRASNYLVSIRAVEKVDKGLSIGLIMTFNCIFTLIPGPILYGWIMDQNCLVWGQTCSGTGNCWVYDSEGMRFWINFVAGSAVAIGMLFDVGVWVSVRKLQIFDQLEEDVLDKMKEQDMNSKYQTQR